MRRLFLIATLVLLALTLLPSAGAQAQDARCFPETGFCISGPIRRYWEQNGGLPVFGYPTTPLQTETVEGWTGPVQWFERDRLEDHTNEGIGVLAGRLGAERLAQQGRPWRFRALGPAVPGCRGFPETGYYLCGGFLTYWEQNGGLARFGYPVTEQIAETLNGRSYTVQYFERRRMEYHPENRPPFDILLGLLGNEVRSGSGPTPPPPPTATPAPVSQQIRITEPAENALISSPIRISGTTTRTPAGRALSYEVREPDGEWLGDGQISVSPQGTGGSFSDYIAYIAPRGSTVIIELTERDPSSGAVIARTQRSARYRPTDAQRVTIDRPTLNSRVGTRIQVAGRTALYPSEGDLVLRVTDSRGAVLVSYTFLITGQPGEAGSFFTEFDIPDQAGSLITVEVQDINARGVFIAGAQTTVYAGTPYPAP